MLVSGVQQSDSVIHIHVFRLYSIIGYYKMLNIVSCVIHKFLLLIDFMYDSLYMLISYS